MNTMQSDDQQQEQMGEHPHTWRRSACWARGMAAVICSWVVFGYALSIPIWHSDKEIATIGRMTYCGLPIPWVVHAPGLSMMDSWVSAKYWLLPVNLVFWTVLSCLLWRVRTRRAFSVCMIVSEVPILLFVLYIYANFLLA